MKTKEELEKLGHIIKDEKGGFGGYQAIMCQWCLLGASKAEKMDKHLDISACSSAG